MDIREKILISYADSILNKINRKVITQLQKLNTTTSGVDSPLKNVWDEICVQIQGQESVFWNIYEQEIDMRIHAALDELKDFEKTALWLMTENGQDFYFDNEFSTELYYDEHDIINDIKNTLFTNAANWTNARITKYLENEFNFD